MRLLPVLLTVVLMLGAQRITGAQQITVGSKPFTESYVLGEIAKKLLQDEKFEVQHKRGLGKTIIIWSALKTGAITLYPEYTGTISEEILKAKQPMQPAEMRAALAKFGVGMTEELGFNNTYALTMRSEKAKQLGISKISDLRRHPELKVGVTHEFLGRQDGWKPLSARYGLNMTSVRGIEHALAYPALKNGQIDITDAYSTDAKIAEYKLIVLEDDLQFFPQYKAVFLYRLNLDPRALAAIRKMTGTLDETRMTQLNAEAERTSNYTLAAASYFGTKARAEVPRHTESFASRLTNWILRHLQLVSISMLMAIVVGIPLGIWAGRPGLLSQVILGITGVIQTIPSLALLALLVPIPFLGISPATAIIALFLYSLLPIVRNTATGLQDIPAPLRESAAALGLEPRAQLRKVFLPMASRTILAGIKTSAIINVGTATLAALIGAGGLGEPIIEGLSLVNHNLILQGAIPAAVLALLVQFLFDFLDRLLIPQGLRLSRTNHR